MFGVSDRIFSTLESRLPGAAVRASRRLGACVAIAIASAASACSSQSSEGVSVRFSLQPNAQTAAGANGSENAFGYRVVLTDAYIALSSIQVLECGDTRSAKAQWSSWFLGTAYAHELGTATLLSKPIVGRFVQPQGLSFGSATLGSLSPPANRYCQTRLSFRPADEHTLELPQAMSMKDHSVYLAGTFAKDDRVAPFEAYLDVAFSITLASAIDLTYAGANQSVAIQQRPSAYLHDVDFAVETSEAIARRFVTSMQSALTATVQ
jgi:hypothetical protein